MLVHRLHRPASWLSGCNFRSTNPPAPRLLSSSAQVWEKPLPPRTKIDENSITESFLKGTGPGGQKINKTSSAVQLKHLPTGIVVKCQGTRSRQQNRKTARRLLGERLEELEMGSEARTAIKAERVSRKKASADKKKKRKYRRLEEEKAGVGGMQGDGKEIGDEDVPDNPAEVKHAESDTSLGAVEEHRPPPWGSTDAIQSPSNRSELDCS